MIKEIKNAMQLITSRKGWKLLEIRYLSKNESDRGLYVTFTYNEQTQEYQVHLYNNEYQSFSEGYYTKNSILAENKYNSKQ